MADDERPPEITPWGPKQEEWEDMAGFWWVSTPRHGGIYLTPEQRKDIPDLIKPHSSDADGIWWEEDCACSLPIVCLLLQRGSLSEEEEYVLEGAHYRARDYFPDEWEQMTGREIKPGESYKREQGPEIVAIHSDELLAGTIWRSSAENPWVPDGMVGVAAYPGEAFLESNMDPARRHAARYFLIPEGAVKWRTPPFEFNPAYQDVTGRDGVPPSQAKEAGRTGTEATHIAVSYKTAAGVEFTSINAVSADIARELDGLKEKPRGADLVEWLEDRGCKLDCATGPAYVRRNADGSTSQGYLRDGKWHREDGPARTVRDANGEVVEQHYFQDGTLHREDGPARVTRTADGATEEAYYRDGRPHRADGPAFVRRGSDGVIIREDYRLHGKRVAKAIFEKEAKAEPLKSQSPAKESQRDRPESTVAATELTVHKLLEDPWLVLDHPLPEGADPQLLKAVRAAAVVCRYEAEDLIAHDSKDPHARDLKKIDAIFTDIRHRLGESEPEALPLDPETEKILEQHEKTWTAQKQRDRER